MKFKPWGKTKAVGRLAPHPVDERTGFADQLQYNIESHSPYQSLATRGDFDRIMVGRIVDDRRYLGNGGWQKVNVESSRLNELREGRP